MKNVFTTKRICRAGIICALYVALTYAFMPFAFGPVQVRPAEALCLLPLLFPEAVPALFVGCALSNIASPYVAFDVPIGSMTTLLASLGTYMVGRFFKTDWNKVIVGGLFPVLLNALILPIVMVFIFGEADNHTSLLVAYYTYFGSIAFTQAIWVYALGTPLYLVCKRVYKTA